MALSVPGGQVRVAPEGEFGWDEDARAGSAVIQGDGVRFALVEKEEGEAQILGQIDDPGVDSVEYSVDLPPESHLEVLESGEVAMLDDSGSLVAGMSAPWAVDAQGGPVQTSFEWDAERSILTQSIPKGLHADRFPVMTDPYLGKELYHKATTSGSYGSRYKINAFVTPWGRTWTGRATFGYHRDEVKSDLKWKSYWYSNSGSIREQHYCHVFFGGPAHWEPDYNMESWRPYVSWWRQAQNKCNP